MPKNEALTDHPGYKVARRMEGLEGYQRQENRDTRVQNCSGLLQTGNCDGDAYWNMPDGNWWTYPGIGGTAGNRNAGTILSANPTNPGYDFVGGQQTTDQPITAADVNQRSYTTGYTVVVDEPAVQVQERLYNNCSDGVSYNCYSNCNCACACACACNCDCHNICFLRGTPVLMADGSERPIERVRVGDQVIGAFGFVNTVRQVTAGTLGPARVFLLNKQLVVLGGHRFWVPRKGWAAITPEDHDANLAALRDSAALARMGQDWHVDDDSIPAEHLSQTLEIGDVLAYGVGDRLAVETLDEVRFPPETAIYELHIHNGSGSYTVYGGLWATGSPDYAFDFAQYLEKGPGDDLVAA